MKFNKLNRAVAIASVALLVTACGGSDDDDGGTADGGAADAGMTDGGMTDGGMTDGGMTDGGTETGVSMNTLDRMGRPGVSTALIELRADRTTYNQNGDPATWEAEFGTMIQERLATIDSLDGISGNALLNSNQALGTILVDDRLQIDTSRANCDDYLALEIGVSADCGGRTLRRDVIDDTLRHLVSQDMPVSDLSDEDSPGISDTWPFLGAPN